MQVNPGTIFATILGLVAAGIVLSSIAGTPVFGSDRAALVALVAVGFGMCVASGIGNPAGAPPPGGPLAAIAGLAGVLSIVVLLAVLAGWTPVLDPIAGVMYGTTSAAVADKIGVVLVGLFIAISWIAATARQLMVLTPSAT